MKERLSELGERVLARFEETNLGRPNQALVANEKIAAMLMRRLNIVTISCGAVVLVTSIGAMELRGPGGDLMAAVMAAAFAGAATLLSGVARAKVGCDAVRDQRHAAETKGKPAEADDGTAKKALNRGVKWFFDEEQTEVLERNPIALAMSEGLLAGWIMMLLFAGMLMFSDVRDIEPMAALGAAGATAAAWAMLGHCGEMCKPPDK